MGNVEAIGGKQAGRQVSSSQQVEVLKILAVGPIAPHAKHL